MLSTCWVFTLQKPTKDDWPAYWPGVSFAVYQLEGPNPHYQGYLEFSTPKTFWDVKAIHSKAYWAPAFGTREQNIAYCTKERTRISPGLYSHDD